MAENPYVEMLEAANAEIERLRAALQRIVDSPNIHEGGWHMHNIACVALDEQIASGEER